MEPFMDPKLTLNFLMCLTVNINVEQCNLISSSLNVSTCNTEQSKSITKKRKNKNSIMKRSMKKERKGKRRKREKN